MYVIDSINQRLYILSKSYLDSNRLCSLYCFMLLYTFHFIHITHNSNNVQIRNANNVLLTHVTGTKSLSLFSTLLHRINSFLNKMFSCLLTFHFILNESSLLVKAQQFVTVVYHQMGSTENILNIYLILCDTLYKRSTYYINFKRIALNCIGILNCSFFSLVNHFKTSVLDLGLLTVKSNR